jgi:hypothetical protein
VNSTAGYLSTIRCKVDDFIGKFNVLLTGHRDISVQYESIECTIYFQFISIINIYMFRAGLLLIIRRYYEQVHCSSSGGTTLYIQQLVCVMLKIMELFKIT